MKRAIALLLACITLCSLCGCSTQGRDYKAAMKLYESQEYDQALALFQELGEYEDAADMALRCTYQKASTLYITQEYDQALALFRELGEYEDAADMAAACACKKAEALIQQRSLTDAAALLAEYYQDPQAQQLFLNIFLEEGKAYADHINAAINSWGEYLPIWMKALQAVTAKTPAGKGIDLPKVDQSAPQITAVQRSMEKANKIVAVLKEAYPEQVLQVCDEQTLNLIQTFFQSAEIIDQQFQDLDSWVTLMLFYGVQDHNAAKGNAKVMNALYAVQDALEFLTEHQG